MWSSDEMIQELKNRGKRITKQRKIMVEVIASKKVGDTPSPEVTGSFCRVP